MKENDINWKRMRFKNNKVWMAVDRSGNPVRKKGRLLIKYQRSQDYQYWVNPENVSPLESSQPQTAPSRSGPAARKPASKPPNKAAAEDLPLEGIIIYTDGASSGNPGPSGIGVVFEYGDHSKEISRYIGQATNNIAELEAIRTALAQLKQTELPVRILTDSSYAFGLLTLGWKPKKNVDLVADIKKKMQRFKDLQLIKVKGHADVPGNEKADRLATSAIRNRTARD